MRRTSIWLAGFTAVFTLSVVPILAGKPPTPKGPKTTVARPAAPGPIKASGPSMKAVAPKAGKTIAPKSARPTVPKEADKRVGPTTATRKVEHRTVTAPVVGRWTPRNPVAQKLSTKPQMLAKVERVLPGITDLNAATAGFKNYGQFVAAVNATQNQGVDFAKLKALMTGINLNGTPTGQPTLSLGQAKKVLQTTPPPTTLARR
jgi:hypothetical protein